MKHRKTKNSLSEKEARTWKQEIRQVLHQTPPFTDSAHLQATLLPAKKEVCLKQQRHRISFAQFLRRQLPMIGRKLWILQGLFLLSAYAVLSDSAEYLRSPLRLAKLLFCLSIAAFMTALPLLYRSSRWRMQEIEAAARFSSVKLLLARLIAISIGDIFLLCAISLTAMAKTNLSADTTVIYLCFPFLLAGSGCLYMLGHLSPNRFLAGSLLFCIALLLLFSALPEAYAFVLQPSFFVAQIISCALLLAFCGQQLYYLVKTSCYEELQLN